MSKSQSRRRAICLVGMAVVIFGPRLRDVSADEPDAKTRAQTLFLEGRKAIDENKWDEGCPKVRESLALFPVANSLFSLAQCEERDGLVASALSHWQRGVALVDDPKDPRTTVGNERIEALEPRVPRIRVIVPPESVGATVLLDGTEQTAATLATPLRVDPGKHVFIVRMKGRQDNRKEIDVAEKERTEFVAALGAVEGVGPVPTASGSTPPPPPSIHPRKVAGVVVAGIGVASLLVSAGTAYKVDQLGDELAKCPARPCAQLSTYQTFYVANAISFGVGVAGVGAGLLLLLTAPKDAESTKPSAIVVPLVGPNSSGIGLSGRF